MVRQITKLLLGLGSGFAFVGSQYPLKTRTTYFFLLKREKI
ncbi:MAG: DUF1016 domain-containing protein [Lachnospiraceae bacterium]|nr:DUF1016 domain-containing protein [Lachnospiraceae bacterium]